jgi:bifunctional non-homologous end joining protein LigD
MGIVEIHPWSARVDNIENPDLLIFDLDAGEGIEYPFVVETALRLREVCLTKALPPGPRSPAARDCM